MPRAAVTLAAAMFLLPPGLATAATGDRAASGPPGASSCSGCHAIHAAAGTSVPVIHGRPAEEILLALQAFRAGSRPATVMNRIASGFTEAESRALATWLSAQPAPQ